MQQNSYYQILTDCYNALYNLTKSDYAPFMNPNPSSNEKIIVKRIWDIVTLLNIVRNTHQLIYGPGGQAATNPDKPNETQQQPRYRLITFPKSQDCLRRRDCYPAEDGGAYVPDTNGDYLLFQWPDCQQWMSVKGTYTIPSDDGFVGVLVPEELIRQKEDAE